MEERQITVDGTTYPMSEPFFVIATQNPVEYQGTFPLPEAQMDRFTLCFSLGYPSEEEELQMLQKQLDSSKVNELQPCITLEEVTKLQQLCTAVKVTAELQKYMINLIRASRQDDEITLGVSPRGTVALQKATQALAFLEGRDYAIPDDVKFLAPNVLSHRLIATGGRTGKAIVSRLLGSVPIEANS